MRKKCVMLSNYVVKDRDAGAKAPKDVNAVFEQNFGKIYMLYHINRSRSNHQGSEQDCT